MQLLAAWWIIPSPSPSSDRCVPGPLPQLTYWAWCHDVPWYGMPPRATLGQLSWLSPLPGSCAPGRPGQLKILDCLATTKNISMLLTLFSSQIHNSSAPATRKLFCPKPGQDFPSEEISTPKCSCCWSWIAFSTQIYLVKSGLTPRAVVYPEQASGVWWYPYLLVMSGSGC